MHSAERDPSGTPLISVVMANFEAGDKIVHALRSVLGQSLADLEVIVSDDASADDSLVHVRRMMALDDRIRLVVAERNGGPAACRNRALDMARGRWIAIVDSDDIIHPERLERLLAAAVHHDADIIADDLLVFFEDGSPPRLMLGDTDTSFAVSAERWITAGVDGSPALGYLKPLINAARLGSLRYDRALRIGEDYDLVLRLLLEGARMVIVPEPFYLYRRHAASISHRLSIGDLRAMIDRQLALAAAHEPLERSLAAALGDRLRALRRGLAYEQLVASIKSRRLGQALCMLVSDPGHLRRLWTSFVEGRRRRRNSSGVATPSPLLVLGAEGAHGIGQAVPDYVPVQMTDWSAPRPRHVWRELAGSRGIGAMGCVALDQAGLYAAGFIPEAEIAAPDAARKAS